MNAFHTGHRSGESSPFPLPQLSCRTLLTQTSLKWVNLDKKNPKANSLTIARHLPDVIRKLLVIKEAIIE